MGPTRELVPRLSVLRDVSEPRDEGMVPESWLVVSNKNVK
jgi:hypothetical protein